MKRAFSDSGIPMLPTLLVTHILAAAVPWVVIKAAPFVLINRPAALFLAATAHVAVATLAGWRLTRAMHGLSQRSRLLAEGRVSDLGSLVSTRIAEVRMVARTFVSVTERLRSQLTLNREFASHVAHEFKTPLTTLRGTIEILGGEEPLPAAQRRVFLDNAETDLSRMQAMVDGLLDLARAEEASPRDEVDLDALVADLDVPFEGSAGVIRGDARLLHLAIRNLLENAAAHGAPPIRILLDRRDGASIIVEDHGAGISPANLPRVFERFFTTSANRRGTGLGLALVRAVARAHGGDAFVERVGGVTRVGLRRLGHAG